MKLYATPLSHFSRKIRLLFDFYGVAYESIDVGNVAQADAAKFAGNPVMRVPVLVDGATWMLESDHIAGYLVGKVDPQDRFHVLTRDAPTLNARAMLNAVMSEEVKVIIARRTEVPTEKYVFFDKALKMIEGGLAWLEANASVFNTDHPRYLEFHLVCAWDHLEYYELVPLEYPRLRALCETISRDERVRKSSPNVMKPKGAMK